MSRAPRLPTPWWSLAFLLALSLAGATAGAQPAEDRHFSQGVLLFSRGAYEDALREFEASRAIRETASVAQNVGACLQALARPAEALEAFRRASDLGDGVWTPAERRRILRTIEELRGRVAELTVRASVPEAEVTLDGRVITGPAAIDPGREVLVEVRSPGHRTVQTTVRPLAPGPFAVSVTLDPLPRTGRLTLSANVSTALARTDGGEAHPLPWSGSLEAGPHELRIVAPGRRAQVRAIDVRAGEEVRLEVLLVPEPPPADPAADRVRTRRPRQRQQHRSGGSRTLPWVLGGIGAVAAVATGVVVWALASEPLEGDWVVEGP